MSIAPPNLPESVDPKLREYIRRLSEGYNSLENHVQTLLRHPSISSVVDSTPSTTIVKETVVQQQQPVQGIGQASQPQFTYVPIVQKLPKPGNPLSQNGQIIFLESPANVFTEYTFDGRTSPGSWKKAPFPILSGTPSALAFNSANESIPSGVETLLTYDSEVYDLDSIHSTSSNTGRLTANTPGIYIASLNIAFAQNNTGNRFGSIRLNGSTVIGSEMARAINDGASRTFISVTAHYQLGIGDYLDSTCYQDTGSPLNIENVGKLPSFGMALVSA